MAEVHCWWVCFVVFNVLLECRGLYIYICMKIVIWARDYLSFEGWSLYGLRSRRRLSHANSSFRSQDHNHSYIHINITIASSVPDDSNMAPNTAPPTNSTNRVSKLPHEKLPRLPKGILYHQHTYPTTKPNADSPKDAQITKRPLPRPSIPSPYTSASTQKTIYISTRTPFMSAVKRVEKLLNLADKRDVQAATTQAQKNKRKRRRTNDDEEDEVMAIARGVEEGREKKRRVAGASG